MTPGAGPHPFTPRILVRARYAVALATTIVVGLLSRLHGAPLPWFVATYAGDALWAMAACWAISIIAPQRPAIERGGLALAVAVGVELSQLYHAPWLDAVRRTRPGGWLLGFGFLWSDLACYVAGVILALAIDRLFRVPTVGEA